MKPTHGLVSLDGVILISASHDHVGPICRTVSDTALMLQALTDDRSVASYDIASPPAVRALTVGVLDDTDRYCDGAPLEPDVREAFQNAVALIATLVGAVRPAQISYPDLGPIIDIEAAPFHRTLDLSRLKPETRAGIEEEFLQQGGDLNSLLARLARFREEFADSFDGCDLVMAPTLPSLPPKILGAHDPFALAACTFAFSQAGAPAISVPCGFSSEGLPIGLMIGGPPGTDAMVLALAAAYEAAGGWRGRRPNL
jgi:aspartyl-tRNA(Asn)/glutamyl-tRNA(Gln) amidotransferase subunit A